MVPHVLLVAVKSGYQTRMFAQAGESLELNCTLATDRCDHLDDPYDDQAIPVRFQDPDGSMRVLADAQSSRSTFTGVVALGDRATLLAALFAERNHIPFHPSYAVQAARSKYLSKELLRSAGLPTAAFRRFALSEDPSAHADSIGYPCVLKPLALSGSRGVIRANDPSEYIDAFHRIQRLMAEPEILEQQESINQYLLVEQYIPGVEFAVEGLVTQGKLQVLAIFDKPDPLEGPYFEETIYVAPSRQPASVCEEIVNVVERGVRALGLHHGPIHAEVRMNDRGIWLLEVAGRPIGGYCAKALLFKDDVTLEEAILIHAAGGDVTDLELAPGASGVMMIPIPKPGWYRKVTGQEEALQVPGITDVMISAVVGQRMRKLPEANSYLGFIFARAESPELVEAALREANQHLQFDIATEVA